MKKKIIIGFFLLLILITAIYFISAAVDEHHRDAADGVDILEGVGVGIIIAVGGFVVFYEIDLFYTVYYFFIAGKTKAGSILNILSNLSLLLIFFENYYRNTFGGRIADLLIIILLLLYIVLKIASFLISAWHDSKTAMSSFR